MISRIHSAPAETSFPLRRSYHFANTVLQVYVNLWAQLHSSRSQLLFDHAEIDAHVVILVGFSPSIRLPTPRLRSPLYSGWRFDIALGQIQY